MFTLAIRNLLVRKARTALSLTGLTVAILGIIALISVSRGIRALLQETISAVPGITVLQKDVQEVVSPRAAAEKFKKRVGHRLRVQGRDLEVVGLFVAGSLFFDRCIVVPIRVAREISGKDATLVSSFYVELAEGSAVQAAA